MVAAVFVFFYVFIFSKLPQMIREYIAIDVFRLEFSKPGGGARDQFIKDISLDMMFNHSVNSI